MFQGHYNSTVGDRLKLKNTFRCGGLELLRVGPVIRDRCCISRFVCQLSFAESKSQPIANMFPRCLACFDSGSGSAVLTREYVAYDAAATYLVTWRIRSSSTCVTSESKPCEPSNSRDFGAQLDHDRSVARNTSSTTGEKAACDS